MKRASEMRSGNFSARSKRRLKLSMSFKKGLSAAPVHASEEAIPTTSSYCGPPTNVKAIKPTTSQKCHRLDEVAKVPVAGGEDEDVDYDDDHDKDKNDDEGEGDADANNPDYVCCGENYYYFDNDHDRDDENKNVDMNDNEENGENEENDENDENDKNEEDYDDDDDYYDDDDENYESDDTEEDEEVDEAEADNDEEGRGRGEGQGAEGENVPEFKPELIKWVLSNNIPRTAVTSLLAIVRTLPCEEARSLPKDSRTLLMTQRHTELIDMPPGQYYHFGLQERLAKRVGDLNHAKLMIHVDGLPLCKSTSSQFYTIMGRIINSPVNTEPFLIGVYHGASKPDSSYQLMHRTVMDVINVSNGGLCVNGRVVRISLEGFVADAVARAFICQVKGHSGHYACHKCTVKGKRRGNRMSFARTSAPARTDEDFRMRSQPRHHIGNSALEDIPNFHMVCQIPLDPMHLVTEGVTKRLLQLLLQVDNPQKISAQEKTRLSNKLVGIKEYVPSEFAKKPRSLNDLKRFKATEFRQILLYTGVVVFRGTLSNDIYEHFLSLCCAMRILSNEDSCAEAIDYARKLLIFFAKQFGQLYGKQFVSYNVHGLIHMADDVLRFGPLQNYSAFPYENEMQAIKRHLRKPNQPLQQLVRRDDEAQQANLGFKGKRVVPEYQHKHSNGPFVGLQGQSYKKYNGSSFCLSSYQRDSCCITNTDDVVEVCNILRTRDGPMIVGYKYSIVVDYFARPCESSRVGIFKVSGLSAEPQAWTLHDIKGKAIRLPIRHGHQVVV